MGVRRRGVPREGRRRQRPEHREALLSTIHEILSSYLTSSGLDADVDAAAGRTVVEMEGSHGSWVIVGEAYEDLDIASVRAILAARVEAPRRDAVTMLLNRFNQGLLLGAWSLDPADGEVQFRAAVDFGGYEPTADLIKPLVALCTLAPEQALPEIEAVATGAR
jgi:hypothetical protein